MDEAAAIATTGPLSAQGPKLFVIDARNSVERKYLIDWLHASIADAGPGQHINWVSLPISDERGKFAIGQAY